MESQGLATSELTAGCELTIGVYRATATALIKKLLFLGKGSFSFLFSWGITQAMLEHATNLSELEPLRFSSSYLLFTE